MSYRTPSENLYETPKKKYVRYQTDSLYVNTMASTGQKERLETNKYVKIKYKNKEIYEGDVDEKYVRSGYGTYYYSNGDIYEGEFSNGIRHGLGEYTYKDGSRYRGYWTKDKKHGRGSLKINDNEFDGLWSQDYMDKGTCFKMLKNVEVNEKISNLVDHLKFKDKKFEIDGDLDEALLTLNKLNLIKINDGEVIAKIKSLDVKGFKKDLQRYSSQEFSLDEELKKEIKLYLPSSKCLLTQIESIKCLSHSECNCESLFI